MAVAPLTAVVAASVVAIALGGAAAADVRLALALTAAVVVGAALVLKPSFLLPMLVVGVFLEVVSLGGLGLVPLIAPVGLLFLLAAALRPGTEIRVGAPLVWAFAYAIWAYASGLWTVSLDGTAYLIASLAISVVYMLCFAALLDNERELERVLYAFTFAALAIGAFAIGVFALGFSESLTEGRSTGGTGDPNVFAAYQVVALPLAVVLADRAQKRWERVVVYGAILAVIGSVLTSVSRGGVLTLTALTLLLLVAPARTFFRSARHKAIFATAAVIAATVSLAASGDQILPRLESVFGDDAAETAASRGSGRLEFWAAAWRSAHERPLNGLGYGAFRDVSNELIVDTPGVSFQHFELRPGGSRVHSAYLGSLAELGIVGLALFLGLLCSTALALRRTAKRARAAGRYFVMRVANALLLSLLGWSIASVFLSSETSRPLWIVVGLALALPKLVPKGPPRDTAVRL
ncbi:MAG TPA: O-antigen ligase family protein [Gaiellaceae bacterium]|nr:O-antigen ligase family protein [Gaiellaceae bacterium]